MTLDVEFLDICATHGLHQFVTEPTRLGNILDLLLSNDNCIISNVSNDVPFGTSDHNSLIFSIVTLCDNVTQDAPLASTRMWNRANWTGFADYCENKDWYHILSPEHSQNELWAIFTTEIDKGIDLFVPLYVQRKSVPIRQNYNKK
jgi:hypothetical protein